MSLYAIDVTKECKKFISNKGILRLVYLHRRLHRRSVRKIDEVLRSECLGIVCTLVFDPVMCAWVVLPIAVLHQFRNLQSLNLQSR